MESERFVERSVAKVSNAFAPIHSGATNTIDHVSVLPANVALMKFAHSAIIEGVRRELR